MSSAALAAEAGSVALKFSVSQSRTRQRPLRGARGQVVRLAEAVHAGEPGRVELVHEVREVLFALRGRDVWAWRRTAHRAAGTTRAPAPGGARHPAGFRPDGLEREAVRIDDGVPFLHEQRILRRRAVQLFEREAAGRIGELARRPAALHHDPVTRLQARGLGGEDARAPRGASPRLRTAPARARFPRRA